jgi:hypothetical protein
MKLRPRIDVQWFPRRWPYFAIGVDMEAFHLCLWLVDIAIWWNYF